jgi:hypothetical protein
VDELDTLPLWFYDLTSQTKKKKKDASSASATPSPLLDPLRNPPSVGVAAVEKPNGAAYLEPEPSICHYGFDPYDCHDADPSGSYRMIEIQV